MPGKPIILHPQPTFEALPGRPLLELLEIRPGEGFVDSWGLEFRQPSPQYRWVYQDDRRRWCWFAEPPEWLDPEAA